MNRLQNKTAVVTGGSRGMGRAIVKELAAQGANVVFTYASSADKAAAVAREVQDAGGKAIAVKADNAIHSEIVDAIHTAVQQYGGVDILVNNAGIAQMKPFEDYTLQDYEDIMGVNVRAVFVASQEALKHMKAGGRIITIGSNLGDMAAGPNLTLYTTSKTALQGLTRGMAHDLGNRKITVNLVQPGPIDTDMNPADSPWADAMRARMPLGEYGKGEDIAAMVSFLAGDESKFITGAMLTVDGGFNA
ncbi:MAG TPA: 3-oxoacyl-ACP reductase family protein [Flavipsychrobacter sp.]